MVESATRLINCFGWKGARRPDEAVFKWNDAADGAVSGTKGQRGLNCRIWLGGANAGMQLNLQARVAVTSPLHHGHITVT